MRRRRQPAQTASRTLPTHSHQQKTSNSHHRSTKTLPTKKIERISIQVNEFWAKLVFIENTVCLIEKIISRNCIFLFKKAYLELLQIKQLM